jgi:hypothetical protein
MKRSVVALGILGLIWAVALPAANAAVLIQDKFDKDDLLKNATTYVQGFGLNQTNDPSAKPWTIRDGILSTDPVTDGVTGSDGTGGNRTEEELATAVPFVLLTGDKAMADVSVESRVYSAGQNSGTFGLILRATPKTKPTDPDTWYQLNYYTLGTEPGAVEGTLEGVLPGQDQSGVPLITGSPTLRIMKVVNGKWTMLADINQGSTSMHIPQVNNAGVDHDTNGDGTGDPTGAIFRFVAKGNVLEAWCALPGKAFQKFLSVVDSELKAGKVGFTTAEYNPAFDDLVVQDAP